MTYYDFITKWLPQLFMQDRAAFEKDASEMFMKSRTIGYDVGVARATRALDELEAIARIVCDN